MEMGHLLNATEGIQISKKEMPISNAKKRISSHVRNIVLNMEQQQEMARYFLHRDMEGASIFREPWVERQIDTGHIYKVIMGQGIFQF